MHVRAILESKGAKGAKVATVAPDTPLATAASRMQIEQVGALVASRDGKSVAGIIDERDIVRAYVRHGPDLAMKTVADVMRAEVVTCTLDEPVRQVMAKMTRHRVRHLPVLDGATLAGIVSIGDVVKSRLGELELETGVLRDAYIARV